MGFTIYVGLYSNLVGFVMIYLGVFSLFLYENKLDDKFCSYRFESTSQVSLLNYSCVMWSL